MHRLFARAGHPGRRDGSDGDLPDRDGRRHRGLRLVNRLKGEAPLKLSDGREFVFHLDFDALVEAEQAYGKPLPRLMADASQGYVGAEVAVSVVSLAERLFELNIGNSLNSAWHKSVWHEIG